MKTHKNKYRVAIVGGGPVGLFLACCLHEADISCIVLEKRPAPITHSRSIGIHPVSLQLFQKIGLAEPFITGGIKVEEGRAYCNDTLIGRLSFRSCPPPFPFILTMPQFKTEALLARALAGRGADILHRNARVEAIAEKADGIELSVAKGEHVISIEADFVVGCDGKNSLVRRMAGIPFSGKNYPDTYIMGDFWDNTTLGNSAGIFLCKDGVIESFPLSQTMRRWVVKTKRYLPSITRRDIEWRLRQRINHELQGTENSMLSSFSVQKKMAGKMNEEKLILAGDAAHVVSPIGGQGMNLGWLDAWDLCTCLQQVFRKKDKAPNILKAYSKRRLKIARKAARRAEFNMALGSEKHWLTGRKLLLQGLLKNPAAPLLARLFTMHGLRNYPF